MSIFDIGDSQEFLASIERRYEAYNRGRCKSTEDLLFIIMGLCHLREWIAPDFNPKWTASGLQWGACDSDEKSFSREVYLLESFDKIRRLCNATKHFELKHGKQPHTQVAFDSLIDDWPDIDSVASFDSGPPTCHKVDGTPVDAFIDEVLQKYRTWFDRKPS